MKTLTVTVFAGRRITARLGASLQSAIRAQFERSDLFIEIARRRVVLTVPESFGNGRTQYLSGFLNGYLTSRGA